MFQLIQNFRISGIALSCLLHCHLKEGILQSRMGLQTAKEQVCIIYMLNQLVFLFCSSVHRYL